MTAFATSAAERRMPEHGPWAAMIARCYSPSAINYMDYGGRGITVCDRWRRSFAAFLEDMGQRPSRQHSIDRIDNDGHYEPENCRWATKGEQSRNQRRNVRLTVDGVTKTAAEWARDMGMNHQTLSERLKRGWDAERAVRKPIDTTRWSKSK